MERSYANTILFYRRDLSIIQFGYLHWILDTKGFHGIPHGYQGTTIGVFRMAQSTFAFSTTCLQCVVHLPCTPLLSLKWVQFERHLVVENFCMTPFPHFRVNKFLILNSAGATWGEIMLQGTFNFHFLKTKFHVSTFLFSLCCSEHTLIWPVEFSQK